MNGSSVQPAYTQENESITAFAYSNKVINLPRPLRTSIGYAVDYPWSESVTSRLEELIRLQHGWDGYKGTHVGLPVATFTWSMLEKIIGYDDFAPQIVPGSSGDLQVEWHTSKGDIELHVRAPNNVHAWHDIVGQEQEEEITITNDFTLVTNWIKQIKE